MREIEMRSLVCKFCDVFDKIALTSPPDSTNKKVKLCHEALIRILKAPNDKS